MTNSAVLLLNESWSYLNSFKASRNEGYLILLFKIESHQPMFQITVIVTKTRLKGNQEKKYTVEKNICQMGIKYMLF